MRRALLLGGLLALAVAGACAKNLAKEEVLNRDVPANSYRARYGYVLCTTDVVVHPNSTAEVAAAIKKYSAQAKAEGKQLKIRVTRNMFHTSNVFPCPNQNVALKENNPEDVPAGGILSVAILTDRLNTVLGSDPSKSQLRVGTGMDLNELFKAATDHKMSVQLMTLPFYAGLTLGGILTTASHGTGDLKPSVLKDMVVDATWVDANGDVHVASREATPDVFRGLSGGLGLIGAITELTLQLTPPTNTKLKTVLNQPDTNLFETIEKLLKETPHILIFWRPDMQRFSAFLTSIAAPEEKAQEDVMMTLLPDLSHNMDMADGFKQWQDDIRDEDPMRTLMCTFPPPVSIVQSLTVRRAWAKQGGRFGKDVFDVVAPTNQMQATECDNNCLWNSPVFSGTAQDGHWTIDWDAFKPWINDVKRIFMMDLQRNGTRMDRCQGAGYLWLRFGKGTDDYLAGTSGLRRPVYLQSTWLRSTQAWQFPLRYGYVPELIEHMTICKYKGRPHTGKNWDRTFTHPRCPVRKMFPLFDDMLKLQAKVDPAGVFEPALFTKVKNQEAYKYYPGCATDYECYCEEDVHCAPEFKCVPSLALPEFKVCKPPADWDPALVRKGAKSTMAAAIMGASGAITTAYDILEAHHFLPKLG